MNKILLRAGKSPFKTISPEQTLKNNVLGTNSGNLIFAHSVYKALYTPEATITTGGYNAKKLKAEEMNEKYDVFVMPLANAFRGSFMPILDGYSALIEKLKIPVVVPGVGVQASLDYVTDEMAAHKKTVYRFVKAVLDKSASIGVRGECSYQYLRNMGFADDQVDIIGCPSMFYYGDKMKIHKKKEYLTADSKVSINLSPYASKIEKLFNINYKLFNYIEYIPQNNDSLEQMLWSRNRTALKKNIPHNIHHKMFLDDKISFFVDILPWFDFFDDIEFSFGTRIHGNIMPLIAGRPSHVLAHDSRTKELAEYFDIPYSAITDLSDEDLNGMRLFEKSDYTKLEMNHQQRFENFLSFMEKNKLKHIYPDRTHSARAVAFDKKLSRITFPKAVGCPSGHSSVDLVRKMDWLLEQCEKRDKKISDLQGQLNKYKA